MDGVAVLASGGLDSSVLIGDLARETTVFPLYVEKGLAWEAAERRALESFIRALDSPNVAATTVLSVPVRDLYGRDHWSLTGQGVPEAGSAADAVLLPGRNVLLLSLAAVWCSTHDIERIVLGSLGDNPFPDATPEFFEESGRLFSKALGRTVTVTAPYRHLHKADLIRRFSGLPLEHTLTCIAPVDGQPNVHCGACNKCYERRAAFAEAGVSDPTTYAC